MTDQKNNPYDIPTERIDLPSKGLLYPRESPLHLGYVEITYPTAKHEDILTNINFIQKGIAEEKFLEALIVSQINYRELLIGDKDALMVAARILAFGKDYSFSRGGVKYTADLTKLDNKIIDENALKGGKNEFDFLLPIGKATVTGYCIKFKSLKDIKIDVLEAAIRFGFDAQNHQNLVIK